MPRKFPGVLVVGMFFRDREGVPASDTVASFVPPVGLLLEREPQNPHDSMAIKVFYEDIHIGYIERGQAAFISPLMDEGIYFTCTVVDLKTKNNNLHPVCDIVEIESPQAEIETQEEVPVEEA